MMTDRNYWMHRISHWAPLSHPLLEDHNLLSIGFSDFAAHPDYTYDPTKFDRHYEKAFGSLSRARHYLYRFMYEMKPGNRVVVPSWGEFHVYDIADDQVLTVADFSESDLSEWKTWDERYIIKSDKHENRYIKLQDDTEGRVIDLGFFRKVVPVARGISRAKYADSALTSRMKYRGTNIDMTGNMDSIEKSIEGFKAERPINLSNLVLEDAVDSTLKIMKDNMNPEKLEVLVVQYFQKLGAKAGIPAKNDPNQKGIADADIIATFEPIKAMVCVQAKFYTGKTDNWAIEQIEAYAEMRKKDTEDDGYSKLYWVISTGDEFTESGIEKAREAGIQLIDGREFTKMLLQAGLDGIDV